MRKIGEIMRKIIDYIEIIILLLVLILWGCGLIYLLNK